MDPVALHIGNFELRYYSIFILIAAIVIFVMTMMEAKKFGINKEFIFNLLFWGLICGVIGARLYYCIFEWSSFKNDPLEILRVWNGGLAIHGGIIGALIVLYFYSKKYNCRLLRLTDFIVVPLILGQAIGRWGNFFNQEAHGAATTVATLKNLLVPNFVIKGMNIDGVTYFPTFYFESLCCIAVFLLFLVIRRNKYVKIGTMTSLYLICYGVIRFFIEISRTDSLMIVGFKMAQIVSIIMIIVGLIILIKQYKKTKFEDLYNEKSLQDEIKY